MIGRRIKRTRGGGYELRLDPEERELLRSIPAQMREVLDAGPEAEPALGRLFPSAYPNDAEREEEYRALVHDELRESMLGALATLESTVDASQLDEEQLMAWMRAI